MNIENLSNYEFFQLERFGNILPEPVINPDGELEAGKEEADRFAEWTHNQEEQQLLEYENL